MKLLFCLTLSFFFLSFQTAYVNKPVVYLYNDIDETFEIETQAIYGAKVEILREEKNYFFIRVSDGTEAYIQKDFVMIRDGYHTSNSKRTKSLASHIYKTDDTIPYPPILTVPFGSYVKLVKGEKCSERWLLVELVDKTQAWIQNGDIEWDSKILTLEEMCVFSKKFIGLPYTWGGASSFGYDCSGFVQMLFDQMGVPLPRNSTPQANCDRLIPIENGELAPGDLIFFGRDRIGHVGLYLGKDQMIHSQVWDNSPRISLSNLTEIQVPIQAIRRLKPNQ